MNGSVQWSTVQSWTDFHLQWHSNPGRRGGGGDIDNKLKQEKEHINEFIAVNMDLCNKLNQIKQREIRTEACCGRTIVRYT